MLYRCNVPPFISLCSPHVSAKLVCCKTIPPKVLVWLTTPHIEDIYTARCRKRIPLKKS